ncbi:hypothetical protein AB8810_11115 [Xanthomonas sp. NCPPB 3005]|uniref:hypothetical protein n=1 Tax=Xanthomonas sp. NCPPB 3005 TaxID=3240913 RepID=UPI003513C8B6
MEFPKMIYQRGELGDDAVIVGSQAEQDAQKAHGYLPLGDRPKDEGRPPKAGK